MAEAAEHLLAGTGWLPTVMRTSIAGSMLDIEISQNGESLADEGAYNLAAE